jgi:hypothetical protein
MKRFKDRLAGKVGMTALGALNLETTENQGNPLPDKENLEKNQGQGCGKG